MSIPRHTYCAFVQKRPPEDRHRLYHDQAYGFPLSSDDALFGSFILEINQAGLSWDLILKKMDHFKKAYAGFSIERIAAFNLQDQQRLLNDPGIVRNKLKVQAAIYNAGQIRQLQEEHGSFRAWLDQYRESDQATWQRLFKKQFKFTGGKITEAFLLSTGYMAGAHHPHCPIYQRYQKAVKTHWP